MKEKRSTRWTISEKTTAPLALKEAVVMSGVGLVVPVRAAKARLSALLDLVAGGQQVTITSGGVPKAVLTPVRPGQERKRFGGMGDFLQAQPVHGGPSAEELVREDRDSRGW
jgi:prevent-host-death family protein